MGDLVQREHPQNYGGIGVRQEHKNLLYLRNGASYDQEYYNGLESRLCTFGWY